MINYTKEKEKERNTLLILRIGNYNSNEKKVLH